MQESFANGDVYPPSPLTHLHSNRHNKKTMSKRHADSTPDEKPAKRRRCEADEVPALAAGKRVFAADVHDAVCCMCRRNQQDSLRAILSENVEAEMLSRGGEIACTLPALLDSCKDTGMTPLMICAARDHVGCLVLLLEAGAGLDVVTPDGMTALMCAAYRESLGCLNELITRGASLATAYSNGDTALHYAVAYCVHNQADIVNIFLKHGASVDAANESGVTPLHTAIAHENKPAMIALLTRGASLAAVDCNGNTALHHAASSESNNQAELVNMLLKHGASTEAKNNSGLTPLVQAMSQKNEPGALAILDSGDLLEESTPRPLLHVALHFGLGLCAAHVLARGASASELCESGGTPMAYAALGGNVAAGELLLQHGASVDSVDASGNTPLMHCSAEGHKGFTEFLLKHGADVDVCAEDGTTALHYAVQSEDADLCKMLVQHGVPLDAVDEDGRTALAESLSVDPAVCQVMIDAGAQLDVANDVGCSPLLSACADGLLEFVKILLDAGAQLRVTDDGFTALMLAAEGGHVETVRHLLGCQGVDVNEQGTNDHTALHRAATQTHAEVVKLLLRHGADKALRDNDGNTALDCAINVGCLVCRHLLQ